MLVEQKKFSHLVFIGRFQPLHIAHQQVIETALSLGETVILVLGSAQAQRSIKNPFTVAERQQMILSSVTPDDAARIKFLPIQDLNNDQKWVAAIKAGVAQLSDNAGQSIALIGHFKDDSSYYLRLFPDWALLELPNLKNALSATPIRAAYFNGQIDSQALSTPVQAFLREFQQTAVYQQLCQRFAVHDTSAI